MASHNRSRKSSLFLSFVVYLFVGLFVYLFCFVLPEKEYHEGLALGESEISC